MIKIENEEVVGWEHAIRGMRNPLNSWDKSDSSFTYGDCGEYCPDKSFNGLCNEPRLNVGNNDLSLMKRLREAGTDHRKYLRMITVYVDITAPLYWWKEFDTYKVGTVANSCSTMHKIHEKEFTLDDFSCEHLDTISIKTLESVINSLNIYRTLYNDYNADEFEINGCPSKKSFWWQMIQLLPTSYNQRRTVMLNYEVLCNMYKSRKSHKLDEWVNFCNWMENLPYSELIAGE